MMDRLRLETSLPTILSLDSKAQAEAAKRWDRLTKPTGSLGRLEELGIRIAGITGKSIPEVGRKVIFTIAADHGVTAEGGFCALSDTEGRFRIAGVLPGEHTLHLWHETLGTMAIPISVDSGSKDLGPIRWKKE